jgi:hypothetical protein
MSQIPDPMVEQHDRALDWLRPNRMQISSLLWWPYGLSIPALQSASASTWPTTNRSGVWFTFSENSRPPTPAGLRPAGLATSEQTHHHAGTAQEEM